MVVTCDAAVGGVTTFDRGQPDVVGTRIGHATLRFSELQTRTPAATPQMDKWPPIVTAQHPG